jgi:hypothetical protein
MNCHNDIFPNQIEPSHTEQLIAANTRLTAENERLRAIVEGLPDVEELEKIISSKLDYSEWGGIEGWRDASQAIHARLVQSTTPAPSADGERDSNND